MPIQAMQLISQFTCLYGARLRNKRYQFVSGGPAGKYKPPKKVFRDRNSKGKGEVPTLSIFVRASWPGHLPSHRSFPPAVVIFPPRLGGPAQTTTHLPTHPATWRLREGIRGAARGRNFPVLRLLLLSPAKLRKLLGQFGRQNELSYHR